VLRANKLTTRECIGSAMASCFTGKPKVVSAAWRKPAGSNALPLVPARSGVAAHGTLRPKFSRYAVVLTALFTVFLAPTEASAADDESREAVTDPPVLSLETLYHPDHEFDFDGSLPKTHWLDAQPSRLLVQRDEDWQEVDLANGNEIDWPVDQRLAESVTSLGGLETKQVQQAVDSAVGKMDKPNESAIVRIGDSLAMLSADSARWVTRDAGAWKNATLDPSGRRIGYTQDGDLFVMHAASGRTHRLTSDASDTLLDGVLDWTYQEEIYGRGNYKGFWFSHDGNFLAMLSIDIGAIEPYFLPSAAADRGRGIVRRYPKAGDPIPHASLWIWDLSRVDVGQIPAARKLAHSTPQEERLITGVWWSPHQQRLVYAISDRVQSWRELRTIDESFLSGAANTQTLLLREESPTWIDPPAPPVWLPDGSIVWQSELPSGRNRLYRIAADGQTVTPLTLDGLHVKSFAAGGDGAVIAVRGNVDSESFDQQIYLVDESNSQQLRALTEGSGWHSMDVSPDGRWILDRHSTPAAPTDLILRSAGGETQRTIAESELQLAEPLTEPVLKHIVAAEGVKLPALLVRPPSASDEQPCAVVVEVYGGPQSPLVSSRWRGKRTLYRELLARRGIATLVVDNRSSAGRGSTDSWPIHRRVGEVEFADLMSAVEWLKTQSWIDPDRLAIRGWSFGGYMTLYAMTHSDVFAAGIAGGSVTDWREYDAFYTERYMGLPHENADGYERTAPVWHAEKLQGRVLLIHGEADDNVHPSGTMRMAAALQRAGKDFQLMIYPGAAHSITDDRQRWHLMQMIDRFLIQALE